MSVDYGYLTRWRSTRIAVALAAVAGCSGFAPWDRACTLIGCDSGLTVHLAAMPTAPFRVEVRVTAPDGPAVYVSDCADATHCSQDIFVAGLVTDHAYVTVIVAGVASTTALNQIVYLTSHPNGSGCPPKCQQARVQVTIPK